MSLKSSRNYTIYFLLILILIVGDCTQNREKTIMIWHSMRPLGTKILQQKLDQFSKKYPGWQFRQLFYDPETARTNYIISAMGGSGPALFWGASDNIGPFVELEVIKQLDTLFDGSFLDQFITEPIVANTVFQGHLYQIADRVGNHLCLVYNKKFIKTQKG